MISAAVASSNPCFETTISMVLRRLVTRKRHRYVQRKREKL